MIETSMACYLRQNTAIIAVGCGTSFADMIESNKDIRLFVVESNKILQGIKE